jgi:hypothetical protein
MPIGVVNSERPERAEAFVAGCRKAKLKGACTALVEVLKNDSQRKYVSPNEMVRYNGLMGDLDHTFEWLEKVYAERSGRMEYIKGEDFLEPLHSALHRPAASDRLAAVSAPDHLHSETSKKVRDYTSYTYEIASSPSQSGELL